MLTNEEIITKAMYYAFTTLSTVGFGDLKPVNTAEYLMCSLVMFIGVALFSLILSNFLEILATFKSIDENFGDDGSLYWFLNVLQDQFNNGKQLNRQF